MRLQLLQVTRGARRKAPPDDVGQLAGVLRSERPLNQLQRLVEGGVSVRLQCLGTDTRVAPSRRDCRDFVVEAEAESLLYERTIAIRSEAYKPACEQLGEQLQPSRYVNVSRRMARLRASRPLPLSETIQEKH